MFNQFIIRIHNLNMLFFILIQPTKKCRRLIIKSKHLTKNITLLFNDILRKVIEFRMESYFVLTVCSIFDTSQFLKCLRLM